MKVNIEITDKQALDIAKNIYKSHFGMVGQGSFFVYVDELAEIIKISFNEKTNTKAVDKLTQYYEKLASTRL